jgi:hypothetical protein
MHLQHTMHTQLYVPDDAGLQTQASTNQNIFFRGSPYRKEG